MKHGLFSIYDKKLNSFGPVVCLDNEVNANRAFKAVSNDKSGDIGRFPDDFSFYRVGDFDSESGVVDGYAVPLLVNTARSFVEVENAS